MNTKQVLLSFFTTLLFFQVGLSQNDPPVITIPDDVNVLQGTTATADVTVTDDNNSATVTFVLYDKSEPVGSTNNPIKPATVVPAAEYAITPNGDTYTFSWSTTSVAGRSYLVEVTADDGVNPPVVDYFSVNVAQPIPGSILARTFASPLPWYGGNPGSGFSVAIEPPPAQKNIGWIGTGEFVEYLIDVPVAGQVYLLDIFSGKGNSGIFNVNISEEDGTGGFTQIGTVAKEQTGWQTYAPITTTVTFSNAGLQTMRFDFQGGGGINIRDFEFTNAFAVTASAGTDGTIAPSGEVVLTEGSDQTFTFTPDPGFVIEEVLVDGLPVTLTNDEYTLTNVSADATIAVSFVASSATTYTLTPTAGPNGTIDPATSVVVNEGTNQVFTFTPDLGFQVADVLVDGNSVGAVNSYEFVNILADATIAVSFEPIPFSPIYVNVGGGGYTAQDGTIFQADNGASGGTVYPTGGSQIMTLEDTDFANTMDDELFRSERFGDYSVDFIVPNGNYVVDLYFAEIFQGVLGGGDALPGERIFDVAVEGNPVLDDFDAINPASGGAFTPATGIVKSFLVSVTDNEINIVLTTIEDNAKLSALCIREPGVVNQAPAITTVPAVFITAGQTASATISATDETGVTEFQIKVVKDGDGSVVDPANYTFVQNGNSVDFDWGTTDPDDAGDYTATVLAFDGLDVSSTSFPIAVAGPQDITVDPLSVDFGVVDVNTNSAATTITITNDGGSDLSVTDISLTNNGDNEFALSNLPVLSATIAADASVTFEVNFTPVNAGMETATIVITSNDPDEGTVTVNLTGEGLDTPPVITNPGEQRNFEEEGISLPIVVTDNVPPTITVSGLPTGLTFNGTDEVSGTIAAGAAANGPYTVTISADDGINTPVVVTFDWLIFVPCENVLYRVNAGGPLVTSTDAFSDWGQDNDDNVSPYFVTNGGGFQIFTSNIPGPVDMSHPSIPPGYPASLFITERWDPSAPGNPENMIYQFPVAIGAEIEVKILFAEAFSGVTNSGVRVFDVSVEGVVPPVFNNIDPYGTAGPKGAFILSYTYIATDAILDVEFLHDVIENPAVKGFEICEITPPPLPEITVAPTTIDFGGVNENTSSSPSTVTITNDGTGDLTVSAITLNNNIDGEFSLTNLPTLPATITVGNSATFDVSFAPGNVGVETASVDIVSDDADEGTVSVSLDGEGLLVPVPEISVAPIAIDFGGVDESTSSPASTVTITNDGTGDLTVSAITLNNNIDGEFSLTNLPTLPATITVGNSATFDVSFAPGNVGVETASVDIVSDDADEGTVSVSLDGEGLLVPVPEISVAPIAIDFGGVDESTSSPASTVTITNDGTGDLTVSAITLNNNIDGEFSLTNLPTLPATITVGNSATFDVSFAPGNVGVETASVDIVSDDADEGTVSVSLDGEGNSTMTVLYRETFQNTTNDNGPEDNQSISLRGWDILKSDAFPVGANASASDAIGAPVGLDNINAGDQDPTPADGFGLGAAFSAGNSPYLAFTEEFPIDLSAIAVTDINWYQGHANGSAATRAAIRINGQWYASTSAFTNAAVGSVSEFAASAEAKSIPFTTTAADWVELTVDDTGGGLSLGGTPATDLPTSGTIEAFGLYTEIPGSSNAFTLRFDTYEVEGNLINGSFPPVVINPGDQTNAEGEGISLQLDITDPDDATFTVTASGLPASLSIDNTGLITGTLAAGTASGSPSNDGVYPVTVSVNDGSNPDVTVDFNWTVTPNLSPTITNPGAQVNVEGDDGTLQIVLGQDDGPSLSVSASGLPASLSIDNAGLITGTIDVGAATGGPNSDGIYLVTITADDGLNPIVQESFTWTINAPVNVLCSPIALEDCSTIPVDITSGYCLEFDGSEGGLEDGSAVGTGFTMVAAPENNLDPATPTFSGVPGYEPDRLSVANDLLTITASKGIFFKTVGDNGNSQVNGLGVGFDADQSLPFDITTKLVNLPTPNGGASFQQGGIWFGLGESEYVKLVALVNNGSSYRLQLAYEVADDVPSGNEQNVTGNVLAVGADVWLKMTIDPAGQTVTGSYSTDGVSFITIGNSITLNQQMIDGITLPDASSSTTYAGLHATTRNANAANTMDFSFERFCITPAPILAIDPILDVTQNNDVGVCGASVDLPDATYMNAVGNVSLVATVDGSPVSLDGELFPVGTTEVTYTATDDGTSQTATTTFNVIVNDNEAPDITCPADIDVAVAPAGTSAVVTFDNATASDNCSGVTTVSQTQGDPSGSTFPLGTTTIEFTATDASGNPNPCTFAINITEQAVLGISIINTNLILFTEGGTCEATSDLPDATITNAVGNVTVVATVGGSPVSLDGATFQLGYTEVTYTATDDGTSQTATATLGVFVFDLEVPDITCPADINVAVAPAGTSAVVTFDNATATDNCSGVTTVSQTQGDPSGSSFPLGTTTIEFTAEDAQGETNSCTFAINITEQAVLGINPITDVSQFNETGTCGASVDLPDATFINAVGNVTVVATVGGNQVSDGATFQVGSTEVTYTATDDGTSQTATTTFDVIVIDNEAPDITCPADIVVLVAEGVTSAVVTFDDPSISDNCTGATLQQPLGIASGSIFPLGTTTNTFEVTDGTNTVPCSFTVTLTSNLAPVLTNPGSQTSDEGDEVALQITLGQNDGPGLTVSASGLPPSLSISNTGLISGTIAVGESTGGPNGDGIYPVVVSADDGLNPVVEVSFDWTISEPIPTSADLTLNVELQGRMENLGVGLPDYSGDYTIELYDPSNQAVPLFTFTETAGSDGVITLTGITAATYDVRLDRTKYLSRVVSNTTLLNGSNTLEFTLTNGKDLRAGDANEDNAVSALDFSTMVVTFNKVVGAVGYNGQADFNGDDQVGALDFSLLASNFNRDGEVPTNDLFTAPTSTSKSLDEIRNFIGQSSSAIQLWLKAAERLTVGEEVLLDIMVSTGDQRIDAAQAYLEFDPEFIEVLDVIPSTEAFEMNFVNSYDNTQGQISVASGSLSDFPQGDIPLAKLLIRAKKTGNVKIDFAAPAPFNQAVTFGGFDLLNNTEPAEIRITKTDNLVEEIRLYPNPSLGLATLEIPSSIDLTKMSYQVFDSKGREMRSQRLDGRHRQIIDLNDAPAGIYIVRIVNGAEIWNKRLVIK